MRLQLFGRPVTTFAHRHGELLPLLQVQLDAGELHLGQGGDGAELDLRDQLQVFVFKRPGEAFVQGQQDLCVAGGVFDLAPAQFPRPVLPLAGFVYLFFQVTFRDGTQRV